MTPKEYLQQNKVLMFDGSMGTLFSSLPGCAEKRCELANIYDAEKILSIHRAYIEAGSTAIKTNTFSVSADIAAGDTELAGSIMEAGFSVASEAASGCGAFVFADIGPAPAEAKLTAAEIYIAQAEKFLSLGAESFLFETLPTDDGIKEAVGLIKERRPDAYIIVSFAVGPDGFTRAGEPGAELFKRTAANGDIDAVGFNCYSGPHHMVKLVKKLDISGVTVSVMPNAGYPTVLGRRTIYGGAPDYFAQYAASLASAGVLILGGCCGTTPEHIKAAKEAVAGITVMPTAAGRAGGERLLRGENAFWDKLESGKRVIAVEFDTPQNDDMDAYMEGVKLIKEAGADAVTIADCPVGIPKADSSIAACRIKSELGLDAIPHMTCRDRNLNATKALIMGLSGGGVHNVLAITGDPMPSEKRGEVKSVFNCDSRKLAKYITSLCGNAVNTPLKVFGALNVNSQNFELQLKRAKEKEESGIVGFLTQPVLSDYAEENLKRARQELRGKILGGIYPVVSYRNACFMNNEIAGIFVSDEIMNMYKDKSREESEDIAVSLSADIAKRMTPYTDGLYIMTPFNRVSLVCRLMEKLKEG